MDAITGGAATATAAAWGDWEEISETTPPTLVAATHAKAHPAG